MYNIKKKHFGGKMQNSKVINIQLELLKIDCVYYRKG